MIDICKSSKKANPPAQTTKQGVHLIQSSCLNISNNCRWSLRFHIFCHGLILTFPYCSIKEFNLSTQTTTKQGVRLIQSSCKNIHVFLWITFRRSRISPDRNCINPPSRMQILSVGILYPDFPDTRCSIYRFVSVGEISTFPDFLKRMLIRRLV